MGCVLPGPVTSHSKLPAARGHSQAFSLPLFLACCCSPLEHLAPFFLPSFLPILTSCLLLRLSQAPCALPPACPRRSTPEQFPAARWRAGKGAWAPATLRVTSYCVECVDAASGEGRGAVADQG